MQPPPPTDANTCRNSCIWQEKRSQKQYGSHTPKFTDNLRQKVCVFCEQRKPASLEELAFSVIIENSELIKEVDTALRHLPHRICWLVGCLLNANLLASAWRLVQFVAEYGETQPSWFDVEESKLMWLSRFRFTCEVHQKLKRYSAWQSVGINSILQYHSNADNTYDHFWYSMFLAFTQLETETENEYFEPLKSLMSADRNNVVLVSSELTGNSRLSQSEYLTMKYIQYLNKTLAIPIVFKPTEILLSDLKSEDISSLLDYFDPTVIVSVDLKKTTWSVEDLDDLGRVLSQCSNLTDIDLRQVTTNNGEIEDVAPAVSRLLSHHPQLKEIGLKGFQLAGTLASYPLPPVENLRFRLCTFTEDDWNFMANRSDLAFKTLVVGSYFYDIRFPSLCSFMLNHAPTLESLGLEYPTLSVEEICKILRIMAKYNKLRILDLRCMEEMDFAGIEKIAIDIMAIHSTRKFFIDIPSTAEESDGDTAVNRLNEVVRRSCKVNRRPPSRVILNVITF